ncbi:MAG TPA: glycosyltransferase family 4 protein [Armatimonadota bacterium]
MRVLNIGLGARTAQSNATGHAAEWTREISRLVGEYVSVTEGDGEDATPVRLADNATAYTLRCHPLAYPFAAAAFAERLHRREPFDLCTAEDPVRSGLAGALFSRRTGVPLNVENPAFHVHDPAGPHARACQPIYYRIGLRVLRQADSIRNYSPDQDAALIQLGIPRDRIDCIPHPFPEVAATDRAACRKRLNLGANDRMVLRAGRMVPYENVGALLGAFAIMRRNCAARLFLVGDGPCRRGWEARARDLGLADAVTWAGAVPEGDMPGYYAAADVFVAPAIQETGPRTVLEALAANCPVIVTPRMGVVRYGICEHERTAFVVPHDDVSAMASAMRQMLEDTEQARAMAALGRERALDRCALGRVAREVASVFRETVQRVDLEASVRGVDSALVSAGRTPELRLEV